MITGGWGQATLEPASYAYDDKGRRKEMNTRAVEVHQDPTKHDLEKRLAEQQTQLDAWKVWGDEFTHSQTAQPYDWRQAGHASGGGPHADTRPYLTPLGVDQDMGTEPTLTPMPMHRATRVHKTNHSHATIAVVMDT